ncbi:MAG TPA: branched-chain amino acid ABC transporter permease [Lichenihabitans sp.]|nr:branched-chain amino acid ABC transporter permease [Lichenihabitans sp.]
MPGSDDTAPRADLDGARLIASPALRLAALMLLIYTALIALFGPIPATQATLNGLVSGTYLGLGAIGLTLVFGILHLVNFAQGDLLMAGAYATILTAGIGVPPPLAALAGVVATALLALVTEKLVWRPLRRSGAGTLQVFLTAIGLAMVIRFSVQFVAGSQVRSLGADVVSTVGLGGLRLGLMQVLALVIGLVVMAGVGLMLRLTRLGKSMRAFSDNAALAEVSGIDTGRIVDLTWLVSGSLAGVAGILYAAAIGTINPNFGVTLLLSLFAAAVLGGIGNAYGALAGGLVIGLAQDWSTLFVNARWKPAVGFAILIVTLLFMPQGIFGQARRRS